MQDTIREWVEASKDCDYEKARGDQCDNCGRLLDPVDLKNPYSAVSGGTDIEIRDTAHLFLLQSKMQDTIREWVEASKDWPQLARSIALKWLDEGLRDRAITRDLKWGIPVTQADGTPRPGFENKVFYVWFDAPVEYIASTQAWAKAKGEPDACLLYTSPSPRDKRQSRMPSSA